MWRNEYNISRWAYHYCRDVKNDPEVKSLITEAYWAFQYFINIKKDKEVLAYIKGSVWEAWQQQFLPGINELR